MVIKVNINNLINLLSNLLIRFREEEFKQPSNLVTDMVALVDYLEKYSDDNAVLFDKNFVTSREEKGKLSDLINSKAPEIKKFKDYLSKVKDNIEENEIEEIKRNLRDITISFIIHRNNSTIAENE